jgi:hypothetical protein
MPRRRHEPTMRECYPGYPNDLLPYDVPVVAWEQARLEIYRFLKNQHHYKYNLETLLTAVYLQGVMDGAQVQAHTRPHDDGDEEEPLDALPPYGNERL